MMNNEHTMIELGEEMLEAVTGGRIMPRLIVKTDSPAREEAFDIPRGGRIRIGQAKDYSIPGEERIRIGRGKVFGIPRGGRIRIA